MGTISIKEAEKYIINELVPKIENIAVRLGVCLYDECEMFQYKYKYNGLEFVFVYEIKGSNKNYVSVSLNDSKLFFYNYTNNIEYTNSDWTSLVDALYDNIDNILESKKGKSLK